MAIRTILLLVGFFGCAALALFNPLVGLLAYVVEYCAGPTRQWWAAPIAGWGLRYSMTLAVATGIGIILNRRKLRYGKVLVTRQEWLLLLFLAVMWFAFFVGESTEFSGAGDLVVDPPTVKMTKVIIFVFMLTHVVTSERGVNALFWVFVSSALILGLQAYGTPRDDYVAGRLEGLGGPDFSDSNFAPAFLAAMLAFIGVQFLRSGWLGKAFCTVAGVFTFNAVILCRSRGALVAIGAGALSALVMAPRKFRLVIIIGLIVGAIGGYRLTDKDFIDRASTISAAEEERDRSAQSRLDIWSASLSMLRDHPLGVGPNNFFQAIGRYDARLAGRDAHNTVVRCYGELGLPGVAVLGALIVNAIWTLRNAAKRATRLPQAERDRIFFAQYGLAVSLVTFLVGGFTVTLLYTESFWWLLALPVCLERAVANLEAEALLLPVAMGAQSPSRPSKQRLWKANRIK